VTALLECNIGAALAVIPVLINVSITPKTNIFGFHMTQMWGYSDALFARLFELVNAYSAGSCQSANAHLTNVFSASYGLLHRLDDCFILGILQADASTVQIISMKIHQEHHLNEFGQKVVGIHPAIALPYALKEKFSENVLISLNASFGGAVVVIMTECLKHDTLTR
jgi:hypothetical protein